MSDITAASAAASELKRVWALTVALLALLLVVAWFVELRHEQRTLVDGPLALPQAPASLRASSEDGLEDRAIILTPAFTVEAPTTLGVTLRRDGSEGWVGVDLALIEESTGEMRQFGLRAAVPPGAADGVGREASALIDQVEAGRYVVRIAPSWEPLGALTAADSLNRAAGESALEPAPEPAPAPPSASLRIVEGERSRRGLGLAALALLLPAIFLSARFRWRRRTALARRGAVEGPVAGDG